MNDLPLPPPPSPTQLQQFEIYNSNNNNSNNINNNDSQHTRTLSSLSSMSTGSNTTHSSTQSLSPTPYNYHHSNTLGQQHQQQQQHLTHFQPHSESTNSSLSLDQYGSTSPLHSRQASSSSSSLNYGCNNDNYGTITTTTTIPPPPPPPLPEDNNHDLYINTMKQQHNANNRKLLMTKQNENDMNTYNKTNVSLLAPAPPPPPLPLANAQTGVDGSGGGSGAGVVPATQKVYNKFLKEYSNKLLTQSNSNHNNNTNSNFNTLKHSDSVSSHNHSFINNGTPKPFIAPPIVNSKQTQQQHNHYLQQQQQQQQQQQLQTNNSNNSIIINNSLPSVAAITATLNNQLKFDSCQVATPQQTAIAPSSSNLSIVDKSPFNSQIINDSNSNFTATNTTTTNEMSTSVATGPSGDKPFEYITLTGNVIRSVVPPGRGNVNYKVNQGGYARPYGAAPPAAAPKSPVIYPPPQQQQQQQWNQPPPPTQPKPVGGSAYATLPRSNVGQQESLIKPSMLSDTLPRKTNAKPKTNASLANANTSLQHTDLTNNDDPTAMLNESIGKINMGHKMDNFMAEAGKVISNMLEARLANNGNGMPSPHSSSSLSLLSNSSSNHSRSPMVVRKRLDLEDFKDINPTEPAALKPVVAINQNVELKPDYKLQSQSTKNALASDLSSNHPMGKVLELCDNKIKPQVSLAGPAKPEVNAGVNLPPSETVIYRNNDRSNRRASHATDRRSYIETTPQNEQPKDGPVFSISVKALGKPGDDPNKPMSPENEEVVSQLLKEGKKPTCCQCNCEITSGPFITALGKIWCPDHFHCVNGNCRRPLQDIGFVEEKGDLYCEYCFEKYLAPTCSKCAGKIKGDCLNAIGKHFHPECFACGHCGKLFGNTPFFLEDGMPYCEADWNELFTTKCFACGFPVEAGDRWVEALNHNYHSQCFNCTYCKQNLEGQSFYNKGGRPFCKNHAR